MKNLIFKECKNISKSLIYIIFVISIGLFYYSQYFEGFENTFAKSQNTKSQKEWSLELMQEPNDIGDMDLEEYYAVNGVYPYGIDKKEVPKQIEQLAFVQLFDEYVKNEYSYYPYGFIQHKILNSSEKEKVTNVLEEMSGMSIDKIVEARSSKEKSKEMINNIKMDYDRFKELMAEVDQLIGKHSTYDFEMLKRRSSAPLTYQEAKEKYDYFLNVDKISNGYGRLSADYLGIVCSLFPVFIAIYVVLKDKRSKMQDIVYASKISSLKLISSRYIAIVTMCMIPVIILGIISTVQLLRYVPSDLISYFDYFGYIKYEIWWILPTVMVVCALGMGITILTNSYLAIIVQIGWAFMGLMNMQLVGTYGIGAFFIRFNSSEECGIYEANIYNLLFNRIFYAILSLVLMMISVKIFELKREGRLSNEFNIRKIFKSDKVQYKHLAEK